MFHTPAQHIHYTPQRLSLHGPLRSSVPFFHDLLRTSFHGSSRGCTGFLPVGLAYHVAYSIVAAITMEVLVRCAWPKHLDEDEQPKPEISRDPK
ncbi:MAG: hypothetical protein EXS30_10680 [Pedosphaera sp.]|nr:hypothetical protein [Pedosphaera sp.]